MKIILNKKYILIILATLIFISKIDAQTFVEDKQIVNPFSKEYARSSFIELKQLCLKPVKWKHKDWEEFTLFSLMISSCVITDEYLYRKYNNQVEVNQDFIKMCIEPFGTSKLHKNYFVYSIGISYLSGVLSNNKHLQSTSLNTFKSIITAGSITAIPKFLFGRQRPNEEDKNQYRFEGPFSGNSSFFSAHSSISFAAASCLSHSYPDKTWLKISSYSFAGLVAFSRVSEKEHWFSDVFAGAVFGYYIGKYFSKSTLNSYSKFDLVFGQSSISFIYKL